MELRDFLFISAGKLECVKIYQYINQARYLNDINVPSSYISCTSTVARPKRWGLLWWSALGLPEPVLSLGRLTLKNGCAWSNSPLQPPHEATVYVVADAESASQNPLLKLVTKGWSSWNNPTLNDLNFLKLYISYFTGVYKKPLYALMVCNSKRENNGLPFFSHFVYLADFLLQLQISLRFDFQFHINIKLYDPLYL